MYEDAGISFVFFHFVTYDFLTYASNLGKTRPTTCTDNQRNEAYLAGVV